VWMLQAREAGAVWEASAVKMELIMMMKAVDEILGFL